MSLLSDVGLLGPAFDEGAFLRLLDSMRRGAVVKPCSGGRYLAWSDGHAELWIQLDNRARLVGLHPHHAGEARLRIRLERRVPPEGGASPLDGRVQGVLRDAGVDVGTIVLALPDARRHDALELPVEVAVQVTAFAHELQVWTDPAAYDADQDARSPVPVRSLTPTWLDDHDDGPSAVAQVQGEVLSMFVRTNGATGLTYVHALIATQGGTVDAVTDPALVPDGLVPGCVVRGRFWLSGRLLAPARTGNRPQVT